MDLMEEEKTDLKDEKKSYIIVCTKTEYDKIKECVKAMYEMVSKAPKKFRTPQFYVLENVYKTKFND